MLLFDLHIIGSKYYAGETLGDLVTVSFILLFLSNKDLGYASL